jgi:DNA-binding SARP family transcriptional activator/basic membrane lipoprotein Med (substrate-binding protein (PBP1-ABC) superfamily)
VDFRILGPLEVIDDEHPLDLSHKQRALLAILLIASPRVVSTDRLLDDLWGDESLGKENTLWTYISRLRAVLDPDRQHGGSGEILLTKDHGYALDVPAETIDARRFERMAAEGAALIRDEPGMASKLLRTALSMWRGPALDDFAFDEFARAEIIRLEELRLIALEDRFDADLRLGRSRELVAELESVHQQHPLREGFVGKLMLALYRSGRQADALRAFERFRKRLGDELGLEPSPELRRLEEQVLLHDSRIQGPPVAAGPRSRVAANPFKGLRAFRERDAADFFGRERIVGDVVRRLGQGDRLIALVGPSGSGKSSILKAGVIPAVRKDASAEEWFVAEMVPGAHPFAELEAALLRASLDGPDSLGDQLAGGATGTLRAVLRMLPNQSSRMVLAIDQFEELFTLVDDEEVRARFLAQLIPVLDDPHGRIVVVLTLRSDFYSRPLRYPDFGTRLGDGIVNVTPMLPDELEAAARKPAWNAGVTLEPSLLAKMLSDVIGEPGALPLFQYTLTELFERRGADTLTLADYETLGGVEGTLSRRAEDRYAELDDAEREATRQLLLRLVAVTGDEEWTRRRVPAAEILDLGMEVVALQTVIERYTEDRLLTLDQDPVTGAPTIEIAHEALLAEWRRLHDWIDAAKEDLQQRAALDASVAEWEQEHEDPGFLLSSSRLVRYEAWAAATTLGLTQRERAFLLRSIEARDTEQAVDRERTQREVSLRRRATFGLGALLAVIVAGVVAVALVALGVFSTNAPKVGLIHPNADNPQIDLLRLGMDEAERRYGIEPTSIAPLADPRLDLTRLCESGYPLVLVASTFFIDLADAGPTCDETLIAGIEWPSPQAYPALDHPNVVQADVDTSDGTFLAGAAAALTTQTGTVAFIQALPMVPLDVDRAQFAAGVASVDPGIAVESVYVALDEESGFFNPAGGKAAAEQAIGAGADVVFNGAIGAGPGILEAVREATEATGIKHWYIGSEADDYLTAAAEDRQYVLTSVVKRLDVVLLDLVDAYVAGDLEPGPRSYTLGNGAVELSTRGGFLDDHLDRLAELRDDITSGRVVVPTEPSGPVTLTTPPGH